MTEAWRAIPGYEGLYEVSDLGRVRSFYDRRGGVLHKYTEPLILRLNGGIRLSARLARKPVLVHRLVLTAFVGPCPEGQEGSHLNGDPRDNRLVNLVWETHVENMARQSEHGTRVVGDQHPFHLHPELAAHGEAHYRARLTVAQVIAIRAAAARGETHRVIGQHYGMSRRGIGCIVSRRNWAHVGDAFAPSSMLVTGGPTLRQLDRFKALSRLVRTAITAGRDQS